MNHLLNLLKALAIAFGWYWLLFAGIRTMLVWRFGEDGDKNVGFKDLPEPWVLVVILMVVPFFMALGALYLPLKGRLCVALIALLYVASIWWYVGNLIGPAPRG